MTAVKQPTDAYENRLPTKSEIAAAKLVLTTREGLGGRSPSGSIESPRARRHCRSPFPCERSASHIALSRVSLRFDSVRAQRPGQLCGTSLQCSRQRGGPDACARSDQGPLLLDAVAANFSVWDNSRIDLDIE